MGSRQSHWSIFLIEVVGGNWNKTLNPRKINIPSGWLRTLICNGSTVPALTLLKPRLTASFVCLSFLQAPLPLQVQDPRKYFVSPFLPFLSLSPRFLGQRQCCLLLGPNTVFPDVIPCGPGLVSFCLSSDIQIHRDQHWQ